MTKRELFRTLAEGAIVLLGIATLFMAIAITAEGGITEKDGLSFSKMTSQRSESARQMYLADAVEDAAREIKGVNNR